MGDIIHGFASLNPKIQALKDSVKLTDYISAINIQSPLTASVSDNSILNVGSSGGEGDAVWGSITGTLSNQTDLQLALNGKVPTTRTVNGLALSSNITLTKTHIGLSAVPNLNTTSAVYSESMIREAYTKVSFGRGFGEDNNFQLAETYKEIPFHLLDRYELDDPYRNYDEPSDRYLCKNTGIYRITTCLKPRNDCHTDVIFGHGVCSSYIEDEIKYIGFYKTLGRRNWSVNVTYQLRERETYIQAWQISEELDLPVDYGYMTIELVQIRE